MNDLEIIETLKWALKSPQRIQRILVQSVIDELDAVGEVTAKEIIFLMEQCKARGDQEDCDYLERKFRQSAYLMTPSQFCEVRAFFEPAPVGMGGPGFGGDFESDVPKGKDLESEDFESNDMITLNRQDMECVHPAWDMYLTLRRKKSKVTISERKELLGLMDDDLSARRVRSIEKRFGFNIIY